MGFEYGGPMTKALQEKEQFGWMERNYGYSFGKAGAVAGSLDGARGESPCLTSSNSYELSLCILFKGQEY